MTLKLGLKPLTHDDRDLLFANYKTASLAVPKNFGHETLVKQWGMLANDSYGDCFPAGQGHTAMIQTAEGGHPAVVSDADTLKDYFAMNGVKPGPAGSPCDQGTDPRVGLKYHQKTGMLDATGKRHKLAAYVALEPGNLTELAEAAYLFGAAGVALDLPRSAQTQFPTGYWRVVAGSPIEGGHWVICVGRRSGYYLIVSWGGVVLVTAGFLVKYMQGAFGMLSREILDGKGRSPEGFEYARLSAGLSAL